MSVDGKPPVMHSLLDSVEELFHKKRKKDADEGKISTPIVPPVSKTPAPPVDLVQNLVKTTQTSEVGGKTKGMLKTDAEHGIAEVQGNVNMEAVGEYAAQSKEFGDSQNLKMSKYSGIQNLVTGELAEEYLVHPEHFHFGSSAAQDAEKIKEILAENQKRDEIARMPPPAEVDIKITEEGNPKFGTIDPNKPSGTAAGSYVENKNKAVDIAQNTDYVQKEEMPAISSVKVPPVPKMKADAPEIVSIENKEEKTFKSSKDFVSNTEVRKQEKPEISNKGEAVYGYNEPDAASNKTGVMGSQTGAIGSKSDAAFAGYGSKAENMPKRGKIAPKYDAKDLAYTADTRLGKDEKTSPDGEIKLPDEISAEKKPKALKIPKMPEKIYGEETNLALEVKTKKKAPKKSEEMPENDYAQSAPKERKEKAFGISKKGPEYSQNVEMTKQIVLENNVKKLDKLQDEIKDLIGKIDEHAAAHPDPEKMEEMAAKTGDLENLMHKTINVELAPDKKVRQLEQIRDELEEIRQSFA